MVSAGAVLGLALGYAGALALPAVFETETAIALPVAVTLQEIGLVAILIGVGLMLAVIPSIAVYRQPVAVSLRA